VNEGGPSAAQAEVLHAGPSLHARRETAGTSPSRSWGARRDAVAAWVAQRRARQLPEGSTAVLGRADGGYGLPPARHPEAEMGALRSSASGGEDPLSQQPSPSCICAASFPGIFVSTISERRLWFW